MKHTHKWVKALTESLEAEVDEATRERILVACGRSCIPRSFVKKARKLWEGTRDIDAFLEALGGEWSHLKPEDDGVFVEYDKCYCPLVKTYPEAMTPTWCNCSRGWAKELFETALGRQVEVEMLDTIRQGGEKCRFQVHL